ncbi:protein NPAT [Echinops telfairi]|uniref:Protein NPAT n=1 Tax=Echinops telfairi TaxID=9371 RepID=A0AC55DPK8_ECHTE|nr:protein NPAT [Echinops telfairi]
MSSLWKKLDHTLSQIRSMQSSPGVAASQRARTRNGIAEIKRQKRLASHAAPRVSSELLTLPYISGQFTASPLPAAQVVRPVGHISTPLRSNFVVVNHAQSQETVTTGEASNIPAPQERKTHASLMSPGRRKSESQKKTISLTGPHSTIRNFQDPNAFAVEKQMVIENAREKILSSKSLQEKLAENINKFLTSDSSMAQVPKPAECKPAEPEASVDELLGLPSEIHMSEEAIQDILEQTESDPAFQALFDLFDYDDPSVQPPFCTSYQNEEASTTLKNDSNHNELTQEAQEHFSQMGSSIQKRAFKTAIPVEQKCNLDITFESMPNLNDFNQRGNSDAMCNQPCVELYTSQIATETELPPNVPSESQLQPDQSEVPIASFISHETNNENLVVVSGKCSQLLSQNSSLTGKPSNKSQLCENPNDTVGLTTTFHDSKSPDSSGIHQNKMEMNSVLPIASQQISNCQDNSALPSNISISVENSALNGSEQQVDICLAAPVTSVKPPNDSTTSVEFPQTESEAQLSKSEKAALDSQESLASVKEGDTIYLSLSENSNCVEVALMPPEDNPIEENHSLPSESVCASVGETHPESQNTSDKPRDNATEMDASNIVSLKIIISEDSFVSTDTELNSAISSISGENLPTIILSSPKSSSKNTELAKCLSSEETSGAVSSTDRVGTSSVEQGLLALKPEDSKICIIQSEDSIVPSASIVPCVPKDGGFIQLMPATSTTFGNSNNILIATCVTDPAAIGTTVSQSNVVVLPGNSAPITAQPPAPQFQTPPRSSSVFAVNQGLTPNLSQGSAIIIASPVQPVLQGMVGMIPVSVVGQNGNTFSAAPRQVLRMPLTPSVCSRGIPQFPVPPKSQKTQGLRSKPCTGKQINNVVDSSHQSVGSRAQRTDLSDKSVVTDLGRKLDEVPVPLSGESTVPLSKPFESHRRVLCFDSTAPLVGNRQQGPDPKKAPPNNEKNDISLPVLDCPIVPSPLKPPSNNAIKREKPVPKILSKSETAISRHTTIRETQPEKKVLSPEVVLESFHKATANKENELCRDKEKQKNPETTKLSNGQQNGSLRNEKTGASLQELTQKQGTPSNSKSALSVGGAVKDIKQEQTKAPSGLISPLSKHTTDMLEGSRRHSPVNKLADGGELPVPRTPGSGVGEKHKEEPTDVIKVPSSRRFVEDSAPKVMIPPVTPDVPACSPASETGSENSVSMAAHTLMILSRAAISRTASATPLKDNTQQQFRASRSATKKRKIEELDEHERNSRTSNKNLGNSSVPMKKKKIKKKKLPSSFPAGMDVDKFLLSLHYDE